MNSGCYTPSLIAARVAYVAFGSDASGPCVDSVRDAAVRAAGVANTEQAKSPSVPCGSRMGGPPPKPPPRSAMPVAPLLASREPAPVQIVEVGGKSW